MRNKRQELNKLPSSGSRRSNVGPVTAECTSIFWESEGLSFGVLSKVQPVKAEHSLVKRS